jgi:phosphoenolpyruvate carboxykinase (ATP)
MHCSANVGGDGDGAILFGLSGTGKTTLSADPDRLLIGDDEHDLDRQRRLEPRGRLLRQADRPRQGGEPVIAAALSDARHDHRERAAAAGQAAGETDPQELDLTDRSITENTRFAYPLSCNPGVADGARGPHPTTIVLLTADAFGVLPPVAVLDAKRRHVPLRLGLHREARRHRGGRDRAQGAFSACFGAPFMSHKASVYAELLAKRMGARDPLHPAEHRLERRPLRQGQAHLDPAHPGPARRRAGGRARRASSSTSHPIFNLKVPTSCPAASSIPFREILRTRATPRQLGLRVPRYRGRALATRPGGGGAPVGTPPPPVRLSLRPPRSRSAAGRPSRGPPGWPSGTARVRCGVHTRPGWGLRRGPSDTGLRVRRRRGAR